MTTPLSRRFALAACAAILAVGWPAVATAHAFYFEQWPSNNTGTGTGTGTGPGTGTGTDTPPGTNSPPPNTTPQTPEPATALLGLIGAAGVFAWRKRRSA
jgi:MYXO-CTERM domain-containing protein